MPGSKILRIEGTCPACGFKLLEIIENRIHCGAMSCARPSAAHELLSEPHITAHRVELHGDPDDYSFSTQHPMIERLDGQIWDCTIDSRIKREIHSVDGDELPWDDGIWLVSLDPDSPTGALRWEST